MDAISIESIGGSTSSSSVSLPPIRPLSSGASAASAGNPCRRCQFNNELFNNFCIKCGYALAKKDQTTKDKGKRGGSQNKVESSILKLSQSTGSFNLKQQSLNHIQSDYSVDTRHGGGGGGNKSKSGKKKSVMVSSDHGVKGKDGALTKQASQTSIISNKNGNKIDIQPLQPPPVNLNTTSQSQPETEKSLNATWSASSVLTISTATGSASDEYSDITTLDLPPPVLKALTTKVEPDEATIQRQRLELQEKFFKASMLEISNAELLEQMYHKLSLLQEMQKLPRTDSMMSIESLDSLPNVYDAIHNNNSYHRPKKLKSQRSMGRMMTSAQASASPSSSSSMRLNKSNHSNNRNNQSHNHSFLSIGSVQSVVSTASTVHPLQGNSSFYGGGVSTSPSASASFYLKPTSSLLERKPSKYARHQSNYLSQFESVVSMREKILEEKKVSAGILGNGSVLISDTVDKITPNHASSRLSMPIAEEPEEGKAWLWGDCLGKSTAVEIGTTSGQTVNEDGTEAGDRHYNKSPTTTPMIRKTLTSAPSALRLSTILSRSHSSLLSDPEVIANNAWQSQKSMLSAAHHSSSSKVFNASSNKSLTSNSSFFWGSLLSGQSEKDQEQTQDILNQLFDTDNKSMGKQTSDPAESACKEVEEQPLTEEEEEEEEQKEPLHHSDDDFNQEIEEDFDDENLQQTETESKFLFNQKKRNQVKNKLPEIPSQPLISSSVDVPTSMKKHQTAIEQVNDMVIRKRQQHTNMRIPGDEDSEDDEDRDRDIEDEVVVKRMVVDEDDKSIKEIEEDFVMQNTQLEHRDHFLLLDLSKRYLELEDERRTDSRMQALRRMEQEMNRPPKSSSRSRIHSSSTSSHNNSGSDGEGEEDEYDFDQLFQSPFVLGESIYSVMPTNDEKKDIDEELYLIQEERDRLDELREENTKSIRDLVDTNPHGDHDHVHDTYYMEEEDALLQPVFDPTHDHDLYSMDSDQIKHDQEQREQDQLEEEHSFEDLTASFDDQLMEHEKRAAKRAKASTRMENSNTSSSGLSSKRNERMAKNQHSVLAQTLKPIPADGQETIDLTQTTTNGVLVQPSDNINFNSNLSVGKFYMISYERMKKNIDHIYVDFRVDINTLSEQEIEEFRNHYDRARVAMMLGQEVNQQILNEMKLFHERASLQRSAIAFNISECLVKATTMDRFFREQYEQEREVYMKTVPSYKKHIKKIDMVNDEMKEIQERGNLAMQQIGNQIKELQIAEQQILRALKQEEFAINETIDHWRPKHGKRLTELAVAIGRAEGWLKSRNGFSM